MTAHERRSSTDEMERRMSSISTLTRELSKISSKDEVEENVISDEDEETTAAEEEFMNTKYWKDYHEYNSKLNALKKEIREMRNLNHEYTGEKNFEAETYQKYNQEIEKAIKDTNKSYKDFNGINHECIA